MARAQSVAAALDEIHSRAAQQFRTVGHRYTATCRAIVDELAHADTPMTIAALVQARPELAPSSTYRTVSHLQAADIITEAPRADAGRFELSESVSGRHHHHALCRSCGSVTIAPATAAIEAAVLLAGRFLEQMGFRTDGHRVAFIGTCAHCR